MNKILIIGLGSIGQRHLRCLIDIGEKNIAAYRTNKGKLKVDSFSSDEIKIFYDLNQALDWNPTHVIISNPTSLHIKYLSILIKSKAKIFVEKPVVHDYYELTNNVNLLNDLILHEGNTGYNLRFHGLFIEITKLIKSSKFGRPFAAYFSVGHYLPYWHPYEDYRISYVSRKELGGGALRTLSHELDLAQYFFGSFTKVYAKVNKLSDLEIDTDDFADIIAENKGCERTVIHLNLLNPNVKRTGFIYFEEGMLEYNFVESKIEFTSYKTKETKIIYSDKEDYNLQYIRQMKNFLYGTDVCGCTIKEGLEVDKIISLSEKSNKKGEQICLN